MSCFFAGRRALFLLGLCLESGLVAQTLEPQTLRAPAGEARTAIWRGGAITTITAARITPSLQYPIRVEPAPGGLRFVIPPATPPGEYRLEVSGRDAAGREMSVPLQITVDAVTVEAAAVAARPPVVLLNGFQVICTDDASTVAASADTFGQLATLLQDDGASVLYFNNCSYGDISIEQLAAQLAVYLAGLRYTDGTPVPQVDLVAHSMGGLIVRSYLSGKSQTSGVFSPPSNPMVRKFVAIGTPHFGSFQAGYIGVQESEMALGNQFLWDLATWNQGQDDLRGVDALAVIGNAGTYGTSNNASDGVVSLTSGSLGFVEPDQRTRIVPYCHIPPDLFTDLGIGMSCNVPEGIAYVDSPSHLTAQIVRSFLASTTAWQSIGTQPSGDPYLSQYGGGLLALKGSNDVYFTDLASVQYGNGGTLAKGPSAAIASLFYTEFAPGGSYSFSMTHTDNQVTTGTASFVNGSERPLLFKFGPVVTGVQSASSTGLSGLSVAAGSTIYIYGGGFSGTGLTVTADGAALTVSASSDQQITAYLPAGYSGLVKLEVSNVNGQNTVNIMTAPVSTPPAIALSATSAKFAYTQGGGAPASQSVGISNSGGGTLSWTASSNSAWLTVSPASGTGAGTLTIGVNTAGLTAQTYTGAITITAAGASNSPQSISASLAVSAAPPSISLSGSKASFAYTLGGSGPAPQAISISNGGGGTLSWSASSGSSWLTVSPASGTGAGTLTLGINTAGLSAQTYNGAVTVTASGAANSPQTISVSLTVSAAAPSVVVSAVVNSASWTGGTVAPGELVTIGGSLLGPSTGVSGGVDPSTGKLVTQLGGTTVTFNGVAAPLLYVSATQVNAIVPYEIAGCTQATLEVQFQANTSAGTSVPCASAAPGIFTFSASGTGQAAAANQDGTFNGPSSPAAKGSYVTLYFTGGGQTSPSGVTGSITGTSTLKWLAQTATVMVGGTAATVAFDGDAPTFVDGVLQLNIQLSQNTPSGTALPVVLTVGNVPSPMTATLAVQ